MDFDRNVYKDQQKWIFEGWGKKSLFHVILASYKERDYILTHKFVFGWHAKHFK